MMSTPEQEKEQLLHKAVRSNDQEMVDKLLNDGVDTDCLFYGWTPLMVAVKSGHSNLAVWLIERGSNVNFKDSSDITILEEATRRCECDTTVVEALLKTNCQPDAEFSDGETPLTVAAEKNKTDLTKILLEGGADVNKPNSKGETPAYVCCRRDSKEVLKILIDNRADVNIGCEGERSLTPLMKCVLLDNHELARMIMRSKCDMNAMDKSGWSALWYAVVEGSTDLVKVLVKGGADVNFRDSAGRTALDFVKEIHDDDMIETLMMVGGL
ncbi:putative ankyrin repeat protein RF_0381 [Lineus longissimus]|uniref:putative ankyrin repeat protein RF_0381 n=1 Tax=Lineus longissimus TaxID=88925 RepID=UPI002B4E3F1F